LGTTTPPVPDKRFEQGTIGREIERLADIRPDHPAVVFPGSAPLSYLQLRCLIDEIDIVLRMAGFGRSARIAIALPSGPHAALAIVAVACVAVAVPLNPKQTLDEIHRCLAVLRPDAVLLQMGSDSAARRVAERNGLAILEGTPTKQGLLGLTIVAPPADNVAPGGEPEPDASAFILQSSGTTADQKLIPFSHRNMLAAATRLQTWFKLTPQDRCLSAVPVYYSHGLKVTVFTPLLTGGTLAFPTNPSKLDYSEWFGTLRPTWYSAGPTLHRLIFDHAKFTPGAKTMHALRFVLSGGAPLPGDIQEGIQEVLGVPVLEHYGSSEAAQIAANLPAPGRSKLGTCGLPWPGTVIVVGEDGYQLPHGEPGEILVRGPTVMSGYLNAPELNHESFVNGWFKTGDIGSLDEEGFLKFCGRQKELINRGGEKIWPTEIDEALRRHPSVAEAAAFAVPHRRLGEDIAAAVVIRTGFTASPIELRRYLSEQLVAFKVPRRIYVVDQLPHGTTGKVLRRKLSDTLGTVVSPTPPATNSSNNIQLSSQLVEIWRRILRSSSLAIDDDFFDNGGDSLLAVEFLSELECLIGRPVPTSIMFEATTIRQLTQRLSDEDGRQPKPLIQISSSGRRTPLIFFHGNPSGGGYVARFAKLLGTDQPLLVVVPHGLDDQDIPLSLEAMAADRLHSILNAQPEGPYRLGGYCVGGLVAFEVARLLIASGKKVEIVAMIDPPTLNARRSVQGLLSFFERAALSDSYAAQRIIASTWCYLTRIERLSILAPEQRWAWTKNKARGVARLGADWLRLVFRPRKRPLEDPTPFPKPAGYLPFDDFVREYSGAMSRYIPAPLAVRVICYSAEYPSGAWRRISPDLEVIKLSGSHYAFTVDPSEVVNHLRRRLDESIA